MSDFGDNPFLMLGLFGAGIGFLVGSLSMVKTTMRVLAHVARHDPAFIVRAIVVSSASAGVGYLLGRQVKIEIFLCGALGFLVYVLFKLCFERG